MADILTPAARSALMSRIRGRDTKIELRVRRGLHALGLRFVLGGAGLPGRPDIVLPRFRAVVFVHGCFWHGHSCHLFRLPKTRTEFWEAKIEANRRRDFQAIEALESLGWRVFIVWECELRGIKEIEVADTIRNLSQSIRTGDQA